MRLSSTLAIAVPALLVGAAIGYFFVPSLFTRAPENTAEEEVKKPEKNPSRGRSLASLEHDAELEQLRAENKEQRVQIEDLERKLDEQPASGAEAEETTEENVAEAVPTRMDRPRRFGPPTFAELEEMRQNDPERYVQETNRIAQFRAGMQGHLQNQLDILKSADTAHMTEKQREVHEDYLALLTRIDELSEQFNPLVDVPEEQRRAAGQEMRETWHQLHELQRIERDTLLTQTANSLGLRGKRAREVVDGIKKVYEATGGGGPWGRGGRGRGPGGGGRHR